MWNDEIKMKKLKANNLLPSALGAVREDYKGIVSVFGNLQGVANYYLNMELFTKRSKSSKSSKVLINNLSCNLQ